MISSSLANAIGAFNPAAIAAAPPPITRIAPRRSNIGPAILIVFSDIQASPADTVIHTICFVFKLKAWVRNIQVPIASTQRENAVRWQTIGI
jgi:hypothetical protein